jgi:hypothetical protein
MRVYSVMSSAVDAFVKDPQSYLEARAAQYSVNRYLEKAAPELLDIREKDLHANTWTTYSDGRVRGMTDPARCEFVFTKIIELEAERKLRAGSGGNI